MARDACCPSVPEGVELDHSTWALMTLEDDRRVPCLSHSTLLQQTSANSCPRSDSSIPASTSLVCSGLTSVLNSRSVKVARSDMSSPSVHFGGMDESVNLVCILIKAHHKYYKIALEGYMQILMAAQW